jgi:pimeloyl-ACP methyl ester carboxylesterase
MQLRSLLIGVGFLLFMPALTPLTLELPEAGNEKQKAKSGLSDHPADKPPTRGGIGPKLIKANPEAGFEYPYYLYAPDKESGAAGKTGSAVPILVEPNNTGLASDDLAPHRKNAKRQIERGMSRLLADSLGVPVVKPVFPRPVSDPVDWTHYVHSLDLETMQIEKGPLRRVDRQLLRMVEDARKRLREAGYDLREGIMLNGFSGSGVFANRFAALHPEEVISVTAGGIGGMPILPFSEIATRHPIVKGDTYPLGYQIGTVGIEDLTGEPFDREAFLGVRQFLYVGGKDENDPLPYPDAYTKKETRMAALLAYRTDMQEQRFPRAKAAYKAAGAKAVFRIYEGVGHKPAPAEDLLAFHRRALQGDSIEAVRADLGGNVPDPSRTPNLLP